MQLTARLFSIIALAIFPIFSTSVSANEQADDYVAAISHPDRSAADIERDKARKPHEILPFSEIQPGITVLELGAGGGYTTHLVARVVGDEGKVYAQALSRQPQLNNIISLRAGQLFELPAMAREVGLEAGSVDVVLMFFTLHDMYLDSNVDKLRLYKAIYTLLKPGGVLVILDNAAEPDSGLRYTRSLHRIGENFIRDELAETRFEFDAESSALRNADDDITHPWSSYSPRGHHDRFALKFRKPE